MSKEEKKKSIKSKVLKEGKKELKKGEKEEEKGEHEEKKGEEKIKYCKKHGIAHEHDKMKGCY